MLKIFVISLISSTDRRADVAKKLADKQISFEFLDAIDGRDSNHSYLKNYDEKQFLIHRRRKALAGELGCYVSHVLAWEKCVDLNQPIVVLEDDFEITDYFVDGLLFLETVLNKIEFVRLEPLECKLTLTSYKNDTFSLVKQLKIGMCLTGYLITPKGAKNLLKKSRKINYPIDLYVRYSFIHNVLIHAIEPPLVYPTHKTSTIGIAERNQREKGFLLKIKRFFYKQFYSFANFLTNLINALTHF